MAKQARPPKFTDINDFGKWCELIASDNKGELKTQDVDTAVFAFLFCLYVEKKQKMSSEALY